MSETLLFPSSRQSDRTRGCIRLVLSSSVVAAFLLFIFTSSLLHETGQRLPKQPDFPDFSQYTSFLQTVPQSHFPSHPDDNRRIVTIGDIHAMNDSLSALLAKISYNPQSDTLIHLGDLISKSKEVSSNPVLTFMSTNDILGVRGNNDQKVIEWRAWMDWIVSLPGGREWLEDVDSQWHHIDGDEPNPEFDAWLKKSHKKWKAHVPKDWKLLGKHYEVARDMSQEQYEYLCSLPLLLYAPTAHTYFVHAGLLAADPTRKRSDPKQPLSHWPTTADPEDDDDDSVRGLQEKALLNDIPQNQDPWVLMNMRSLSKDGQVTDEKKGTPWADLWNDVMSSCSGTPLKHSTTPLHCFPSTVIYGHAAARDLDVRRWSVGVDTGCAYGRRLTAVVLDANSLLPDPLSETVTASPQDESIPYGDEGTAQLRSVKCHA